MKLREKCSYFIQDMLIIRSDRGNTCEKISLIDSQSILVLFSYYSSCKCKVPIISTEFSLCLNLFLSSYYLLIHCITCLYFVCFLISLLLAAKVYIHLPYYLSFRSSLFV